MSRSVRHLPGVGLAVTLCLLAGLQAVRAETMLPFETPDCIILPEMDIALSSPAQGQLARVLVEESDRVAAGQLLAELTSDIERAAVEIARAAAADDSAVTMAQTRLAYEQELLDSAETLSQRSIVSSQLLAERRANFDLRASELAQARATLRRAALELTRAEALLESRRIRSPIDGLVLERMLDPGEFIREDTPLLRLGKLDRLRVEIILPQRLYRSVSAGMAVTILSEIEGLPATRAAVDRVDAVIDPSSATFGVSAVIDNADSASIAGTNCTARFGS